MRRPGGQDDHLVRPGGAGRCGDRAARARVPPGHHRRPAASAADREPVRGGARGCRRPRGALPLHARRVHLQPDRHSPRRPALHAARFRRRLRRPHAPPGRRPLRFDRDQGQLPPAGARRPRGDRSPWTSAARGEAPRVRRGARSRRERCARRSHDDVDRGQSLKLLLGTAIGTASSSPSPGAPPLPWSATSAPGSSTTATPHADAGSSAR